MTAPVDKKTTMPSIVLLTRNFRLEDNRVIKAAGNGKIYFAFIANVDQLDPKLNKYHSPRLVKFMFTCIQQFNKIAKVWMFTSEAQFVTWRDSLGGVRKIPTYVMKDYTPYSRARSVRLSLCEIEDNYLTHRIDKVYKKFTPFYNIVVNKLDLSEAVIGEITIAKPTADYTFDNFVSLNGHLMCSDAVLDIVPGRTAALKILESASPLARTFSGSRLAAYIKFGCISVREAAGNFDEEMITELIWRDFYYQAAEIDDNLLKSAYTHRGNGDITVMNYLWNGTSMSDPLQTARTVTEDVAFAAWTTGETGYPIVDAAMKQLSATGYMPNRMRLIVGSFAVKTLMLSWRKCEQWFAQQLIDYDPIMNTYGWQGVVGCGPSSQPWFRIMNPRLTPKGAESALAELIKKYPSNAREIVNNLLTNDNFKKLFS
jgi:deoxyribodipyrimidine photo-lyase